MNQPGAISNQKRWSWRRLLWLGAAIMTVLLIALVMFWYLFLPSLVAQQVEKLGLGPTRIGRLSLSLDGVAAHDISVRSPDDPDETWLMADVVRIHHPLLELVSGPETFQEMEVVHPTIRLDVDDLLQADPDYELDWKAIPLPFRDAKIVDGSVVFSQEGATDLMVEGVAGAMTRNENGFELEAVVDGFLDESWDVRGTLDQAVGKLEVILQGNQARLRDGQWQQWPLLPQDLQRYLQVDSTASVDLRITSTNDQLVSYSGEVELSRADVNLPGFQLPVQISRGRIEIEPGRLEYQELVATVDGQANVELNGGTTFDGFPIKTRFQADFGELDVSTIRKVVAEIPSLLSGIASGEANGEVEVANNLETRLELQAIGDSSNAKFGQLQSDRSTTQVDIQSLQLSSDFEVTDLVGGIAINAKTVDQDINGVLATLELDALANQLDLDALGSGDAKLQIPLHSADDLSTWFLEVQGKSESAKFSNHSVSNVQFEAVLKDGMFVIPLLSATPVGQPSSEVEPAQEAAQNNSQARMAIRWPIATDRTNQGEIKLVGKQVPVPWMVGIARRQIQLMQSEAFKLDQGIDNAVNDIKGLSNFDVRVEVPVDGLDDFQQWAIEGTANETVVQARQIDLQVFDFIFSLKQGCFDLRQLLGRFSTGGEILGTGTLDLNDQSQSLAEIKGKEIPLNWLAEVSSGLLPDIELFLTQAGIDLDSQPSDLGGKLDFEVGVQPSKADDVPWQATMNIQSPRLRIKTETLNGFQILAQGNEDYIEVERVKFDVESGRAEFFGEVKPLEQTVAGTAKWEKLSLGWLAGLAGVPLPLDGETTGDLRVSNRDPVADESVISALELDGHVEAENVGVGGVQSKKVIFDLKTKDQKVVFENFQATDDLKDLALNGSLTLNDALDFGLEGNVKGLRLSQVFKEPSVTQAVGQTLPVSGIAQAKFDLSGSIYPLTWVTHGVLDVDSPRVRNEVLSDAQLTWSHSANSDQQPELRLLAFNGNARLTEFDDQSGTIKVALEDIDSNQLSRLFDLPEQAEGQLSGEVYLKQWSSPEALDAEVNIHSRSFDFGPAAFDDLRLNAKVEQGVLKYDIAGVLYEGQLKAVGESKLEFNDLANTELPVKVGLDKSALLGVVSRFTGDKSILGSFSAEADLLVRLDTLPSGVGRINVGQVKWNNQFVTRQVTSDFSIQDGVASFGNIRADFVRGQLVGRVIMPLTGASNGRYEFDLRRLQVDNLIGLVMKDPPKATGSVGARFSGSIGKTITGQGTLSANRLSVLGFSNQTFRMPLELRYDTVRSRGRLDLRRSQLRLFSGTVFGSASVDLGRQINLTSEFQMANLDTGKMFAVAGVSNQGQGRLSGRMVLEGRGVQDLNRLKGSFVGGLDRAEAFKLPILDQLGAFLGGNQLGGNDFRSEMIDLRLSNGRINVRSLNLTSSLAQIAITGGAYLDGRLDLNVAGRIERLNQPALVDEIAGSPLARYTTPSIAFFSQASEFLANRLVFVKVGGTVRQPALKLDSGQQLREETIRYFLRGDQILPFAIGTNN